MMKRLAILVLAALCVACGGNQPETLVSGGYDEQEMQAAIARARDEVDAFIATLASGNGEDFAVKMPVEDNGRVEHFWLTGVSYQDGEFEGQINNDPGVVTNVRFGQKMKVRKDQISDWLFVRDGKMHGNYTLRPLLRTMSEEDAQMYRSMLAAP